MIDRKEIRENYPSLFKIINRRIGYLEIMLDYGSKNDVYNYFFCSTRYLAKIYKKNYSTLNRNINIFTLLGLIEKLTVAFDKTTEGKGSSWIGKTRFQRRVLREKKKVAKRLGLKPEQIKHIGIYRIPIYDKELFTRADEIAEKMLEANFRVNGFSKIWIIKTFSEEVANRVYLDNRKVTDYSNYVSNEIEKYVLNEIVLKGYVNKKEIINNVKINYAKDKNIYWEYGFVKTQDSPKHLIEREFDRSINDILLKNDLEYRKATKELKEKYNLETYSWIIHSIS